MFVGLPRYLEQLLGACYAKEGWELYRFRAVEGERPPQGIHTYDCEVDSAEAAQVSTKRKVYPHSPSTRTPSKMY